MYSEVTIYNTIARQLIRQRRSERNPKVQYFACTSAQSFANEECKIL